MSSNRSASFVDVASCHFDSNTAGSDETGNGEGYPVVAATLDAEVNWGPSTYRNLTVDRSLIYGYAMRTWRAKFNFVPGDNQPDGVVVEHPDMLSDEGKVYTTRVRLTVEQMLLLSSLYVGNYDVTVTGGLYLQYVSF
jgi:hypothetical protein